MKTWETPKLIVLVRNNPQETVLDVCKGGTGLAAATVVPAGVFMGCQQEPVMAQIVCLDCFSSAVS